MASVIISSGHTSDEPGIVANDLREFDVAKNLAGKVASYLRKTGVMTLSVPPDLTIDQRIDWINQTGSAAEVGGIVVEIHLNDGGIRGTEVWFKEGETDTSQKLAQDIADQIHNKTKLPRRGVKPHTEHAGGTVSFITAVKPIACLIKCATLDNEHDAKFLKEEKNLSDLAESMAKAIEKFAKEFKPSTPRPSLPKPESTQSFNNNPSLTNPPASSPMSREQRKEMIIDTYKKALGREPTQNDTNYFLNIAISEVDLLRKVFNSQEHADIIKDKKELVKIKTEYEENKLEIRTLKAQMKDNSELMRNLQQSLIQKNHALQAMQQRMQYVIVKAKQYSQSQNAHTKGPQYQGNFLDRLFKSFSNLFD